VQYATTFFAPCSFNAPRVAALQQRIRGRCRPMSSMITQVRAIDVGRCIFITSDSFRPRTDTACR